MRVIGGHYDGLTRVQFVFFIINRINRNLADTIQAGNECITFGFMGADVFSFIKKLIFCVMYIL